MGDLLPCSEAPLYVRLKQALRQMLSAGMRPGDPFPSESDLGKRYGVSRTTVRLALQALANEGLIVRRQGKGNVVAEPKRTIGGFGMLVDPPAAVPGHTVWLINTELVRLDAYRAGLLAIDGAEHVRRTRLLHLIHEGPVCYQVSYLPSHVLPPDPPDPGSTAITLATGGHLRRRESAEIVMADSYRSQLLDVPVGSPLLLLEKIAYRAQDGPVELSRFFYGGNVVRLELQHESGINPAAMASTPGRKTSAHY